MTQYDKSDLQQIRVAIAEECGWTVSRQGRWSHPTIPDNGGAMPEPPDYCNDLNAMHDAELARPMCDCDRVYYLAGIVGANLNERSMFDIALMVQASALQKAEAFLRSIKKWPITAKEEK